MEIMFGEGLRVRAEFDGLTVETDQPVASGGEGTAASPYDLFLASLGTCAGYFALRFMRQRGIDATGARLTLSSEKDPETGLAAVVTIDLELPPGFPRQVPRRDRARHGPMQGQTAARASAVGHRQRLADLVMSRSSSRPAQSRADSAATVMSRAFVKEDDEAPDEPLPERPVSDHPNYVTPSGLAQLEARRRGARGGTPRACPPRRRRRLRRANACATSSAICATSAAARDGPDRRPAGPPTPTSGVRRDGHGPRRARASSAATRSSARTKPTRTPVW